MSILSTDILQTYQLIHLHCEYSIISPNQTSILGTDSYQIQSTMMTTFFFVPTTASAHGISPIIHAESPDCQISDSVISNLIIEEIS